MPKCPKCKSTSVRFTGCTIVRNSLYKTYRCRKCRRKFNVKPKKT